MESVLLRVRTFDPDHDSAPQWAEYSVPWRERMRVLDALEFVREELGVEIAYEWYCGVKKCGLCTMKVNGEPMLTCWEPAQAVMQVEPIDGFPVVRDLVVDRTAHERARDSLEPVFKGSEESQSFPEVLPAEPFRDSAKLAECIECLACTSACPAWGNGFAGPAALVALAHVAMDPRDEGSDRGRSAVESGLIDECTSCHRCTEVCPVGIPVLERGVQGLRARALAEGYRDVLPKDLASQPPDRVLPGH